MTMMLAKWVLIFGWTVPGGTTPGVAYFQTQAACEVAAKTVGAGYFKEAHCFSTGEEKTP